MKEIRINFETAKLAQEKGFNWPCNVVFDLKNNNIEVDFYEQACLEFIEDCETGYRDKALNYFREDYKRTDDNTDFGYYITRPTQSLLQKWLREINNIYVESYHDLTADGKSIQFYTNWGFIQQKDIDGNQNVNGWYDEYNDWKTYEEALEFGLQEGLKLIEVKGEKHSSSKVKTLAAVDTEKLENIQSFVEYAVTESRFNQALENVFPNDEPIENKKLGDVIRWVVNDVIKEEMDTMADNKIEPKDVNKYISSKVRDMFFKLV